MKFKTKFSGYRFSIWVTLLFSVSFAKAQSQEAEFRPGEVIVKFKSQV